MRYTALLLLSLCGCVNRGAFTCSEASDCVLAGAQGTCASDGRCQYPNDDCPSGNAYSPNASNDANACVPLDTDTEPGAGGDATGETSSATTFATSDLNDGSTSESGSGTEACNGGLCASPGDVEWVKHFETSTWQGVLVLGDSLYISGETNDRAVVVQLSQDADLEIARYEHAIENSRAYGITKGAGELYVAVDEEGGSQKVQCFNPQLGECGDPDVAQGSGARDVAFREGVGQVYLGSWSRVTRFESGAPPVEFFPQDMCRVSALELYSSTTREVLLAAGRGRQPRSTNCDNDYAVLFSMDIAAVEREPGISRLWADPDRIGVIQDVTATDDGIYIGGWHILESKREAFLAELDFTGEELWFEHPYCEEQCEVESLVIHDDTLFAAGADTPVGEVVAMWAYDLEGTVRWTRSYSASEIGPSAFARDVEVLDESLVVVGHVDQGAPERGFVARIRP